MISCRSTGTRSLHHRPDRLPPPTRAQLDGFHYPPSRGVAARAVGLAQLALDDVREVRWRVLGRGAPAHPVQTRAAIEYGFGLPGMFLTIRGAIVSRDVPVLEALVLEGVILVVLANFLVDAFQV